MTHRNAEGLEGVRRTLVVTLALAAAAAPSPAWAGIGIVPKKSIVQVTMKSESEGISIQNQYFSETKIRETVDLTGLVSDEGYVLAFAGGHLESLTGPGIHFTFNVRTSDGKGYPATLAGFDERLSMIYLRAPVPEDLSIAFSTEPIRDNFKFAVLDNDRLRTAQPCPREQRTLSFLPAVELKLADLDLETSWLGAAVIDAKGRLLGLVSAAWPHPVAGFAISEVIPVDLLRASFDTVRKTKENIRTGWVGVYLDEEDKGTRLEDVIKDTPAAHAGLRAGDLIVALDGEPVGELREFIRAVRSRAPGSKIGLTVERDGDRKTLPLVLGVRPPMRMDKMGWKIDVPGTVDEKSGGFKLYRSQLPPLVDQGLVLDAISGQLAVKLRSPIDGGLLVGEVRSGSPGQKAGFLAGDVIFLINGKEVRTLTDAQEILEAASKGFAEIRLVRDGQIRSMRIALQ